MRAAECTLVVPQWQDQLPGVVRCPLCFEQGVVLYCREHLNIVFIGHVDAGKSTTAGQVRC